MEEYNPQAEKAEAQEAFKKYLEENKGQPIDPRAAKAGEREMKLGEKGDYAVYGDEPDKSKKIKSYPKGRPQEEDEFSEMEKNSNEDVNRVVAEMEAQFGEKFESGDQTVSSESIIKKYKEDGWNFVDVFDNAGEISADQNKKGEKTKIVGLGNRFLVFKKKVEGE